ncbi:hypothetical protein E3N88_27392 [Mikania micrantha]|uniref:Uncharacterized protein n=1 Tax=Mikania micrantha TaxID=192012 RepID=A0A5N6MX67_9ASTR|nr:hypothetical protein E3N88_27392 [Mikania micrantha]
MPSRTTSRMSPFEHLFKRKPDLSFLRVFGCQCYPHLRAYNKHKMEFRSTSCVFLGYSTTHHGYRCFDPVTDRIYICRHVRFNESFFPFSSQSSAPTPVSSFDSPYVSSYPIPPDIFTDSTTSDPPEPTTPPETTTPTEPTTPPEQTTPPSIHNSPQTTPTANPTPQATQNSPHTTIPNIPNPPPPPRTRPPNLRPNPKQTTPYNISSFNTTTHNNPTEPTSFTNANKDPHWQQAMATEYLALMRNGTWSLVPRVSETNLVDYKWVYKLKRDQVGNVTRYKARLVAKGFHQQPGIDYTETFSPVVKATTIRVVLSVEVTQRWSLRQLDVQNAFLHGDLKETVYMTQPQGFVDPNKPDHVCLLHKSLYGLKQAPRAWFQRLTSALQALGFQGSQTDPSLFVCSRNGTLLYMLIYVDDIILTGNNDHAIDTVVHNLSREFAIQDMGALSYFLGIEITRHGLDMILSQQKYIKDLLVRAGLSAAKPVPSPMSTSANLSLGDSPPLADPVKYRQMVGALQYATLSRPDITFAVNKVCQFMHSPTENHWSAVKRILRYLQGTSDQGLLLSHQSITQLHAYTDTDFNSLSAFSDADWAGCPDDQSEYKAMADTVAELTWLETLLHELHVKTHSVPTLWCDNLGGTYLSANPVFHARTKHVEVDFHFVREKVAQGQLSAQFISTHDQIADVFTKALPTDRFTVLKSKLQVASRP